MPVVKDSETPQVKPPASPRIFTNTEENLIRSIERLSRWTLRAGVTPLQITKVRACTGLLRVRVELARLHLDREKWIKDIEIEDRLDLIETAMREEKEA